MEVEEEELDLADWGSLESYFW